MHMLPVQDFRNASNLEYKSNTLCLSFWFFQANYYRPQSSDTCYPCDCFPSGSHTRACDMETGQCPCKPGVIGRQCNRCDNPFAEVTVKGCEGTSCPASAAGQAGCGLRTRAASSGQVGGARRWACSCIPGHAWARRAGSSRGSGGCSSLNVHPSS